MTKKATTVDATKIIKTLKTPELKKIKYEIEGETLEILVKPEIPFSQRTQVVKMFADFVFDRESSMDEETGKQISLDYIDYQPFYQEFAFRYAILRGYTNIEFPTDIDTIWLILSKTDLYSKVVEIVGNDIAGIYSDGLDVIQTRKEYMIHHKDFNEFKDRLMSIVNGVSEAFKNIDVAKIMEQMPEELKGSQGKEIMGALMKAKAKTEKK